MISENDDIRKYRYLQPHGTAPYVEVGSIYQVGAQRKGKKKYGPFAHTKC